VKKFSLWGYLLLIVAIVIGGTVYFRDFDVAIMTLSITLSYPLYQKLNKGQQRKWLIPYGVALALVLGGLYYIADLIVFPHSNRAAHRLQDACTGGSLWAFGGLLVAYCSMEKNRKSLTTSRQQADTIL
jgi:hypothetical protein